MKFDVKFRRRSVEFGLLDFVNACLLTLANGSRIFFIKVGELRRIGSVEFGAADREHGSLMVEHWT